MPQLDKVPFLSQFFWLSVFYLSFYFGIFKYFLPKMSRILKYRRKKMGGSHNSDSFLVSENKKVQGNFDGMVAKTLHTSRNLFAENVHRIELWLDGVGNETNKTHYQTLNTGYIQSFGENSLADNLALAQASSIMTEKLFGQLFLSKIQ